MRIDYNNRYFVPKSNTPNGESDSATTFHYNQLNDVVWATYKGGPIVHGVAIAKADAEGNLDLSYSHVNRKGELMTGRCRTRPELLPDGRLRLHEKWEWTCGDRSKGESVVEEIDAGE